MIFVGVEIKTCDGMSQKPKKKQKQPSLYKNVWKSLQKQNKKFHVFKIWREDM